MMTGAISDGGIDRGEFGDGITRLIAEPRSDCYGKWVGIDKHLGLLPGGMN
jgi:hypothetical protein